MQRERTITRYMPLARRVARRFKRGPEPLEDLEQVAYMGLVEAVDRFDPDRGVRFPSYAIPTISGELRRHFRDTSWKLHVPRGTQEAALEVVRRGAELQQRSGREPTVRELASATGLDADEVTEAALARGAQETSSLEAPRGGEDGDATLADCVGRDDARLAISDDLVTLAPRLRALPRRERRILAMRYFQDRTQSDIAQRVGCSQMQVSRLLRQALERLRRDGAADDDGRSPIAAPPRVAA